MAYSQTISIALYPNQTGITDLRAQLVDTAGADVGSAITTGFVEIGSGWYEFTYASYPDSFQGIVKIYQAADSSVILVAPSVNNGNALADAILDRNMASGTDSGSSTVRTVRQALRFLRNKWLFTAGTLTVYKEDDATASWTGTPSTSSSTERVTGNDPAGP